MSKISPCLWFDGNAEDAAKFYSTVFPGTKLGKRAHYGKAAAEVSGQKLGSLMTIEFNIFGLDILGLNGGPMFKFNPSCSFFVACKDDVEITEMWKKLSAGGEVRMALEKYPWAEKYGWTTDKYGVEWQLMIGPAAEKRIAPSLLFVDALKGRGQEAIDYYLSLFPHSKPEFVAKNPKTGAVDFAAMNLEGDILNLMEGEGQHGHKFNEAFSLMVYCDDQKEIDDYWKKLTADGGSEGPCGWCKDKFGVSWQIVPRSFNAMMDDPVKSDKIMSALIKMKKPDLAALERAAYS